MYNGRHVRKDKEKRPKLLKKVLKLIYWVVSAYSFVKTALEIIQQIAKLF